MEQKNGRHQACLEGQVAVITGGASGIGRATCLALALHGARVVVVDIVPHGVQETLREIAKNGVRQQTFGAVFDVRLEEDMAAMARQTVTSFGRIDILVACAGVLRATGSPPKPLVDLTLQEWSTILDTNLKGTFLSNRAVLPTMLAQRSGHIVNISSTYGRQGRAYDSAYCASKFGIIGLSEALAEEVRPYRIKVQVVLPDAVDTPMWEQNAPIPRPGNALPAERIADLILYLLTLPEDTILLNPIVSAFRSRSRVAAQVKHHS